MTNFFGSVMETIHTDSAYNVFPMKDSRANNIKILLEQSVDDLIRNVTSSDEKQQSAEPSTIVSSMLMAIKVSFFCCLQT